MKYLTAYKELYERNVREFFYKLKVLNRKEVVWRFTSRHWYCASFNTRSFERKPLLLGKRTLMNVSNCWNKTEERGLTLLRLSFKAILVNHLATIRSTICVSIWKVRDVTHTLPCLTLPLKWRAHCPDRRYIKQLKTLE